MSNESIARENIRRAKTRLARIYPSAELDKCIADVQEMMLLPIELPMPEPVVDPTLTYQPRCEIIVSNLQVAKINLDVAQQRINSLLNALNAL